MSHRCPSCGSETAYKTFSGGREWDCLASGCGADGSYPEGEAPRRVQMLQSPEGVTALRAEMEHELEGRRDT
ncbi:hypothetical protein EAO77_37990 [Streptomyces sp. t39]|nr:hypothetical protein EAO77_37990 [Streptomyces sp. t39]